MVVIQDGMYANAPEKPLRISGDPKQIEVSLTPVLVGFYAGPVRFEIGHGVAGDVPMSHGTACLVWLFEGAPTP